MHPTQIFLANPAALRVEYRLDDARLILWWSPLAGQSTDCRDRNYSSRDAHLEVFATIELPGCDLSNFRSCDYDPYHCVLHFEKQALHLALPVDQPTVALWSDQALTVDLKSHRFDVPSTQLSDRLALEHREPRYTFTFAAALGSGDGTLRHCHFHAPEQPVFTQATVAPGQLLTIGVGLDTEPVLARTVALASAGAAPLLQATEAALAPHLASGRITSSRYPHLAQLRDGVIRGLHSMIDQSGAFRASLMAIYYLLWVRDSGFSFAYQAAAGWPHKLAEVCRLILDNPNPITDPGLPNTRMFGQLIHTRLGKLEEDGLYYLVWLLFTHHTQHGHLDFVTESDWALIDEALAWVEAVTWDEERGLFGEYFADETPSAGHRDAGWDYAIGKPIGNHHLRDQGQSVARNYDVYFNSCMHSTYTMLTTLRGDPRYAAKAARLWPELEKLLHNRTDGIPTYGELLMVDRTRRQVPYWGSAESCCVWGLSMPNFLPLADWDAVHNATLDAIIAQPDMHFVNGICSALSAVDTWTYPEEKCLALHERLATETATPGKFLPMGGAMPEKFNAPQGNLHHDIRPQGFAMGAWLAAWTSLGLRRLPYGLALRPTSAFEQIEAYPWQGKTLHLHFGPTERALALEIDGTRVPGTLQIPASALTTPSPVVRLIAAPSTPLWLRSTVRLDAVAEAPGARTYSFTAHGPASITFSAPVTAEFTGVNGVHWTDHAGLPNAWFTHSGPASVRISL